MKIDSGHLSYCTNIHTGESWKEHFASLDYHFPKIKEAFSPNQAMGIGLRLSNSASIDLLDSATLDDFKIWLKEKDAYVFTMNGFPYGDFHHAVVKDKVHAPDWTSKERVEYSQRLFQILAELLPEGMEGGISTSPLTYRLWFVDEDSKKEAKIKATEHIIEIAEQLYRYKIEQNIYMHLDIEPEPDGILENGSEFIDWYENLLLPMAKSILSKKLNINDIEVDSLIKDHICLCYDVCHFAISYEEHESLIQRLEKSGIKTGKIQISAALKANFGMGKAIDAETIAAFSNYNELTYLHQVVARKADKSLISYPDLPEALNDIDHQDIVEWRAHFHVPVFSEKLGLLSSTQDDIIEVLKIQKTKPFSSHLEVETYTWEVLPESLKLPIDQSIIRELNWVKNQLI